MDSPASCTLVTPGLYGPPGLRATDFSGLNLAPLETLLARAVVENVPAVGLEATLFHLFGVERDPARDLPVAAVAWAGDTGEVSQDFWLRADPVHLRPDQSRLVLLGDRMLNMQQHEADTIAKEFNALFGADGWRLETPHPERWYLRLPEDPHIRTYDLREALGRHIDGLLPSGARGKQWHAVLNEIQMLLHSSAVNHARSARGAPAVNSVWLWGGGYTPRGVPARWARVWSDEPVATGLARLGGVPAATLPASAAVVLEHRSGGAQLVVLNAVHSATLYGDTSTWGEAMASLMQNWFAPLLDALKRRNIDSLDILAADGRAYRVTPSSLRRFWKRRRSLETYT
ncbi:MAG: hypothetical protein IDH49_03615 [Gammaproteobacteria bacterium]|nr:hypothetical protein [Gammaproteobacteria bacterium]